MKRYLALVLAALLLPLSACAPAAAAPVAPSPDAEPDTVVFAVVTAEPSLCLTAPPTLAPITPEPTPTPEPTATPTPEPVKAELFLPDADCEKLERVRVELAADTPEALLTALFKHERYPVHTDEEIAGLTCAIATETLPKATAESMVIRLDVPKSVAKALASTGSAGERMAVYGLVDTFLAHYEADALILTSAGKPIETGHNVYDKPLRFLEPDDD